MHTYFDLIESLNSFVARKGVGANRPQLRQAASEAIFHVTTTYPWDCFEDQYTIFTHETQDTGTVAFDVSEKTVTLSDATWPAWATYGILELDGDNYFFPTRTSSTVLTLEGDMPATDLSGETYEIRRAEYLLPTDCRQLGNVSYNDYTLQPITNNEWVQMALEIQGSGTPEYYTAFRSATGQMALRLYPSPSAEGQLTVKYRRSSTLPTISGHESGSWAGTIAISGTAVTGTGTSFTSNHEDAYLVVSSVSALPDFKYGDNPYATITQISSVTDSTNLTLAAAPGDGSGLYYRITDSIDMPDHLYIPTVRYAEWSLARNSKADARDEAVAFRMALEDAKTANRPVSVRRVIGRGKSPW